MQREILIDEHGRLESPITEISPPPQKINKKINICSTIQKLPGMKITDFNNEYLTPLLGKIPQEEKTCLLISYILHPIRLSKLLKPSLIAFF